MDDGNTELRRRIARDSVARLAGGMPQTTILSVPLDELAAIYEVVRETADELDLEVEMEYRIGESGLVHLDIWRADAERSGVVGDVEPPTSR